LKSEKDWWSTYKDVTPEWFELFLALESGASSIDSYSSHVIPGLFQTEEFIRMIFRDDAELSPQQIQRRVDQRMVRQGILTRKPDPTFVTALLDEGTLYRTASVEVLSRQLKHLLDLANMPNVTIQIAPFRSGSTLGTFGTMMLMDFAYLPGQPSVAYDDRTLRGDYFEDAREVTAYRTRLTRIQDVALNPSESLDRINRAIKELSL
jgi:hypothetical protein